MRLGYPCINISNPQYRINRGMIKKTFNDKPLSYVSELIIKNLNDLKCIIEWNKKHNILFYRMSSSMFPWMSQYEISDLPNFKLIKDLLLCIGDYAKLSNQRLTFHPGQFDVLASDKSHVVNKTIKDINQHAEIMDYMCLDKTVYNKINIHIGTAIGSKYEAAKRFIKNFNKLSDSAKSRLTVENEDKISLYTTQDLYDLIYKEIGIPIVFDYLHHLCNPGDKDEQTSLEIALSTWGKIMPVIHFSSSRKLFEDSDAKLLAHADYIYEDINTYGNIFDIMLESKLKELSLFKYIKKIAI